MYVYCISLYKNTYITYYYLHYCPGTWAPSPVPATTGSSSSSKCTEV